MFKFGAQNVFSIRRKERKMFLQTCAATSFFLSTENSFDRHCKMLSVLHRGPAETRAGLAGTFANFCGRARFHAKRS
jgi:hypothetical protein